MPNQSPKTIATINFKGGVGKTTITWGLGDILSTFSDRQVLMFDLDAQMSLTQAITLNEDGSIVGPFRSWYENSKGKNRTIFDALDAYTKPGKYFDFPISYETIYPITDRFHFVPSVEDLYWLELDVFDRENVKDFIRRVLGKIANSTKLPQYDYILFDCPPSFTLLSYSVLSCCDLILIPVNPDFFASQGVRLILSTLRMRIEPFPLPKIAIFMNRAKTKGLLPSGKPKVTNETALYMQDVERVCSEVARREGIDARFLKSFVRERVGLKRAITGGGVPPELVDDFRNIWRESIEYLNE